MAARAVGVQRAPERRLPIGIVEPDVIAHERHPVLHLGLVDLLVAVVADQLRRALLGVHHIDARGRVVLAVGLAGDDVGLPDDGARRIVEARMLLGQVDVHVAGAPILAARAVVRVARLRARDVHRVRRAVRHAVLHQSEQGVLVHFPPVRAADHRDRLAVGTGVGALRADGVAGGRQLVDPGRQRALVQRDRQVVVERHPLGDQARVHRSGDRAGHEQLEIGLDHGVRRVGRRGELRVGGQHRRLQQLLGGQLHLRVEVGHRFIGGLDHRVGIERRAHGFELDDEGGLRFVEADGRVRRLRGILVERRHRGADGVFQAGAVVRGHELGRFVVAFLQLERPCPRVHVGQHVVDDLALVDGQARVAGRELEREALAVDGQGVVLDGIGQHFLGIARAHERHVDVADVGVRHEAVGEVQRHARIRDQKQRDDHAERDAEDLQGLVLALDGERLGRIDRAHGVERLEHLVGRIAHRRHLPRGGSRRRSGRRHGGRGLHGRDDRLRLRLRKGPAARAMVSAGGVTAARRLVRLVFAHIHSQTSRSSVHCSKSRVILL